MFSPLDRPTAAKGDVRPSDYMFVSKPVAWTAARYPRELPYSGSRWYWMGRCQVQFGPADHSP